MTALVSVVFLSPWTQGIYLCPQGLAQWLAHRNVHVNQPMKRGASELLQRHDFVWDLELRQRVVVLPGWWPCDGIPLEPIVYGAGSFNSERAATYKHDEGVLGKACCSVRFLVSEVLLGAGLRESWELRILCNYIICTCLYEYKVTLKRDTKTKMVTSTELGCEWPSGRHTGLGMRISILFEFWAPWMYCLFKN